METKYATGKESVAADNADVITVRGLCKAFGENRVLRKFNLDLHKGENLVVLGKSGSGKSVLIKCIIGLLRPDAGELRVFGNEVTELSREELDRMRRKVGFLFQSNALYDSMSIRENLEFPLRRHGRELGRDEIDQLVHEMLANVGLEHTVDMMPSELSGGMRKRIALARTLILKPEVILYDEPTTGLDPVTAREISQLMVDMQKKYNTSSIIISHDINCIRVTANRIILLIDGVCYASGTWNDFEKSEDVKIKEFFKWH